MENDISPEELQRRVVHSFLLPAVRLSRAFRIPLKDLTRLAEIAYYQEARKAGLKMATISDLFQVSMRKLVMLSKQTKENFFSPESEHELPRRIEFMLWSSPMGRLRIEQVLPDAAPEAIDAALEQLMEEGRVELQGGRTPMYATTSHQFRLFKEQWRAQIDGLNNAVGNLCNAVHGRLFTKEPNVLVRTVSFRVRPERADELKALYEKTIWNALSELDEDASGDPDALSIDLTLCWSPYDYHQRFGNDDE